MGAGGAILALGEWIEFFFKEGGIVPRRRRRRKGRRVSSSILLLAVVAIGVWSVYPWLSSRAVVDPTLTLEGPQVPTSHPDDDSEPAETHPTVAEQVVEPTPNSAAERSVTQPLAPRVERLIAAGRQDLERNDLVAARTRFSKALALGVEETNATLLTAELTRIGRETLLSPRILDGDPLVERYIIQTGDSLGKIATANKVSADLIASVNQIADKHRIREGQTIKVIKGPFRAVVTKTQFTLDVYLGDTFVTRFPVGLGADDSTPSGEWRVGTKLENPTYYPPRGGEIIAADDPKNPLGERWIALVGVSGGAAAQERYGIHGTNEPESIGRSVSMGCIRMHNADIEALYTYLVEGHSTVTVRE